jgi:glutathione S-transferase
VLDLLFSQRDYLHGTGSSFGVSDVMLAATLLYCAVMKPSAEEVGVAGFTALVGYMERMGSRAAVVSRYPKEHWKGKVVVGAGSSGEQVP